MYYWQANLDCRAASMKAAWEDSGQPDGTAADQKHKGHPQKVISS